MSAALERMRGGLVVSVQAGPGSPLAAPEHLTAIARAVEAGGAVGIRTEGVETIRAIRAAVGVPVIGLVKRRTPGAEIYITPEIADAVAVAEAGADLVAVDATERRRADGTSGPEFLAAACAELPGRIVADVDSASAGRAAAEAGAAAVATTLSGYTGGEAPAGPDTALVAELAQGVDVPVLAEGRYSTQEEVWAAYGAGAFAVVVGTAITDPEELTRRLSAPPPLGADG
ncbi:MAG TPA: putative N-acetylmannosamine-6-phosphate 2-epimerase [Thermoleophilaceae bacterium]|nr:putative N-acetylmannosamine-6-phosphate 2-epimerase [Thermoleophilaceae bacterium]